MAERRSLDSALIEKTDSQQLEENINVNVMRGSSPVLSKDDINKSEVKQNANRSEQEVNKSETQLSSNNIVEPNNNKRFYNNRLQHNKDNTKQKVCFNPRDRVFNFHQSASKRRGLINMGSTCYMNSALQCLFNLQCFNNQLKAQMKNIQSSQSKHPLKQSQFNRKPQNIRLCELYIQIFDKIKNIQSIPFQTLRNFKEYVQTRNNRFYGYSQQDTMEFLTTLFFIFNQQLSIIQGIPQYIKLNNDPSKKSILQLSKEWQEYELKRDNSIITSKFQGQMISNITCSSCSKKTVSFSKFLSLPITIHKLLQHLQSIESLIEKDCKANRKIENFYCNECGKQTECYEKSEFFKLPEILVVHLKRFTQNYNGLVGKEHTSVKMSQSINLQNSMHVTEESNDHKQQSSVQAKKKKYEYKLNSFIDHSGSIYCGHYTANVYNRQEKKWYRISDLTVSSTSFSKQSNGVYVLFYQRQ